MTVVVVETVHTVAEARVAVGKPDRGGLFVIAEKPGGPEKTVGDIHHPVRFDIGTGQRPVDLVIAGLGGGSVRIGFGGRTTHHASGDPGSGRYGQFRYISQTDPELLRSRSMSCDSLPDRNCR